MKNKKNKSKISKIKNHTDSNFYKNKEKETSQKNKLNTKFSTDRKVIIEKKPIPIKNSPNMSERLKTINKFNKNILKDKITPKAKKNKKIKKKITNIENSDKNIIPEEKNILEEINTSKNNEEVLNKYKNLANQQLNEWNYFQDVLSGFNNSFMNSFSKKEIEKLKKSTKLNIKNLKNNLCNIKDRQNKKNLSNLNSNNLKSLDSNNYSTPRIIKNNFNEKWVDINSKSNKSINNLNNENNNELLITNKEEENKKDLTENKTNNNIIIENNSKNENNIIIEKNTKTQNSILIDNNSKTNSVLINNNLNEKENDFNLNKNILIESDFNVLQNNNSEEHNLKNDLLNSNIFEKVDEQEEQEFKNDLEKFEKENNIENLDQSEIFDENDLNENLLNKIKSEEEKEKKKNLINELKNIKSSTTFDKKLKNHFNIDIISNFIYEFLLNDIINDISYIKLYLPSKYVKGIQTNVNFIKEYLNIILNKISNETNNITKKLNISLGPSKIEKLKFYHEDNFEEEDNDNESEEESNSSEFNQIKYEPILDIKEYMDHESEYDNNTNLIDYQIELYHIHNKMIFDSLNESLDSYRIYGLKGEVMPYKLNQKYNKKITFEKTKIILNKGIEKVNEWASYMCGFIPFKDDSDMNLPIIMEDDILNQIKEERLFKLVLEDIGETNENWLQIEDDELEVNLEITEEIYNFLLEDTIQFLNNNNN